MNKIIIGLTGQSGAGKSTVASVFKSRGFFVIDADVVSRTVVDTNIVLENLRELFGSEVLTPDSHLNRKALAKIVFSDSTELGKLNNLLFPLITTEINAMIDNCGQKYILLDAPQLFESHANQICNKIISIVAPYDMLVARIMNRDGVEKEAAQRRLKAQFSSEFFKNNSDFVISNEGTTDDLVQKTKKIIEDIITSH